MEVAYDRSRAHRALHRRRSKHALIEEAIVVACVIILFLLHFRSALLPILSLPIAVALGVHPDGPARHPGDDHEPGRHRHRHRRHRRRRDRDDRGRRTRSSSTRRPAPTASALLAEAAHEVTPAIFFSLLIIAVAFLPVFTLTGQAGRLFKPLAYTKTFVMLSAALLSITFAPGAAGSAAPRQDPARGEPPGLARPHPRLPAVRLRGAATARSRRSPSGSSRCSRRCRSR